MDKPELNTKIADALTEAAIEHAKSDALADGIKAIHLAGWAEGKEHGYKEGFADGRQALTGKRAFLVPLLIVAGIALGVWAFGLTLRYFA